MAPTQAYVNPDSVLARTAREMLEAHAGGAGPTPAMSRCPVCGEPLPCESGRAAAEVLFAAGLAEASGLVAASRRNLGLSEPTRHPAHDAQPDVAPAAGPGHRAALDAPAGTVGYAATHGTPGGAWPDADAETSADDGSPGGLRGSPMAGYGSPGSVTPPPAEPPRWPAPDSPEAEPLAGRAAESHPGGPARPPVEVTFGTSGSPHAGAHVSDSGAPSRSSERPTYPGPTQRPSFPDRPEERSGDAGQPYPDAGGEHHHRRAGGEDFPASGVAESSRSGLAEPPSWPVPAGQGGPQEDSRPPSWAGAGSLTAPAAASPSWPDADQPSTPGPSGGPAGQSPDASGLPGGSSTAAGPSGLPSASSGTPTGSSGLSATASGPSASSGLRGGSAEPQSGPSSSGLRAGPSAPGGASGVPEPGWSAWPDGSIPSSRAAAPDPDRPTSPDRPGPSGGATLPGQSGGAPDYPGSSGAPASAGWPPPTGTNGPAFSAPQPTEQARAAAVAPEAAPAWGAGTPAPPPPVDIDALLAEPAAYDLQNRPLDAPPFPRSPRRQASATPGTEAAPGSTSPTHHSGGSAASPGGSGLSHRAAAGPVEPGDLGHGAGSLPGADQPAPPRFGGVAEAAGSAGPGPASYAGADQARTAQLGGVPGTGGSPGPGPASHADQAAPARFGGVADADVVVHAGGSGLGLRPPLSGAGDDGTPRIQGPADPQVRSRPEPPHLGQLNRSPGHDAPRPPSPQPVNPHIASPEPVNPQTANPEPVNPPTMQPQVVNPPTANPQPIGQPPAPAEAGWPAETAPGGGRAKRPPLQPPNMGQLNRPLGEPNPGRPSS